MGHNCILKTCGQFLQLSKGSSQYCLKYIDNYNLESKAIF